MYFMGHREGWLEMAGRARKKRLGMTGKERTGRARNVRFEASLPRGGLVGLPLFGLGLTLAIPRLFFLLF